ncbi:HalOD1 output domain-containing protein [Haloprofundus halobius]|uniref:HalOD1 output domain-containing protein n=1 Tax=Haloprofundus halobius TaxID=2876194 RepID=UPI001CC9FFCA
MISPVERHSESVCEQIVTAVAEREGVDPLDLVPLYDALGPGLWHSLFVSTSGNGDRDTMSHSFSYHGYDVTVEGDDVHVSRSPTERKPSFASTN